MEITDVMPEDAPVLYGRHASPFVRRVAVTLRLYGMEYRHEPMMPFGPDKAKLAKFNPIARVPALQLADGEMLVDSAVILDYLDGLVGPERALTPPAGPARRRVLTLLAVAHGVNEKLVISLYERHFRPREAWHRPWLDMCDKQVRDGLVWLDGALVGPYFLGETLSQADVTATAFWLFARGKRPNFIAGLGCCRLDDLAERLQATPAFQATMPEPEMLTSELA